MKGIKINNIVSNRDNYIDALRGLGILAVVAGHALNTDIYYSQNVDLLRKFIYIFNISIFFFVSGCLYKYKNPKRFLKSILKNEYIKFVLIEFSSFLLIPLWKMLNVIDEFDIKAIGGKILHIILFQSDGVLVGAMWFMTLFSVGIVIYYLCDLVFHNIINQKQRILFRGFVYLILSIIGLFISSKSVPVPYWLNYALSMQFIMYAGEVVYQHTTKVLNLFKNQYLWVVILMLIIVILIISNKEIELSKNKMFDYVWFLPITLLGIIFCTSITAFFEKVTHFYNYMCILGRNSFYIMAFHFWGFKLFDGILGKIMRIDKSILKCFPISFPQYRVLYILFGLMISILIKFFIDIIDSHMNIQIS